MMMTLYLLQVASHMLCDVCQRAECLSTDSSSSSSSSATAIAAAAAAAAAAAKLYCVDCCESLCKPCAASTGCAVAGHELVKLRKASFSPVFSQVSGLSAVFLIVRSTPRLS